MIAPCHLDYNFTNYASDYKPLTVVVSSYVFIYT